MSRKDVEQYCAENGIELSVEKWIGGTHVHANIDAPRKIFQAHDVHNLGLWDAEGSPNWKLIGKELIDARIGDCTDAACEYCAEFYLEA